MATVINPFTAVDGNGHVRANAKLYFYQTGTNTPQNTFTDAALSVTATNPVVADSNGLFSGTYLGDPPTFTAYKAILKTSDDVTVWTQDPFAGAPITTPISAALLRGHGAGDQRTSNTTTTITFSSGVWADDTSTAMLSVVAGTINYATVGADGLDAGALANNTWYHRFIIGKADGTTARLASLSPTSPTMPSGYTLKRRTGSFKTNGSAQIIAFTQTGDLFLWTLPVIDVNGVTYASGSTNTVTLPSVPTGVAVTWQGHLFGVAGANWGLDVLTPGQTVVAGAYLLGSNTNVFSGAFASILTNTSAQVSIAVSVTVGGVALTTGTTYGWIDRRGRDD